jgi:hypothetical protein
MGGGVRPSALRGARLAEAVALRDAGWSYAKIGARLGCSESAASNCVIPILGARAGHRMAERDENGRMVPAELERLRMMLLKGIKPVDIQFRMGLSASRIAEERRRYNRELKERGKRPLPPPGNGEQYSGARLSLEAKREVERLYLEGFGAAKISKRTGVSYTHVQRIRQKLVRRLKRKGQSLAGCDPSGKRHTMKDHARAIADEQKAKLRELILNRVPVRRAGKICGIGGSSAYRIRDEIKAELGDAFPSPRLPGRVSKLRAEMLYSQAIPDECLWRFRVLVREHGEEEARRILRADAAETRRNETFEQKLQRHDLKISPAFRPSKGYDFTLGGIATGQIA